MAKKLDVYVDVTSQQMLKMLNDFNQVQNVKVENGYVMVGTLLIDEQTIIMVSNATQQAYDIEQYRDLTSYDDPLMRQL